MARSTNRTQSNKTTSAKRATKAAPRKRQPVVKDVRGMDVRGMELLETRQLLSASLSQTITHLNPPALQSPDLLFDANPQLTPFIAGTTSFTSAATTGTAVYVGHASTFTITTSSPGTPTITDATSLPSGLSFTDNGDGTATISGTPGAGTAGTYALSLTADDGVDAADDQTLSLVVGQSPAITSTNHATFTTGSAGSFTVNTSGYTTPILSKTGTLPSGVSFVDNGDGTGTISGTPGAATGGTYSLILGAANGFGANASQGFTLTVDQAPAITSANHASFTTGANNSFTVNTSGFPLATLSGTGTLPSGVSFVDNGNDTATISGTPGAGTAGTYNLTLAAANGVGSNASQSFTLTVGTPPAITTTNNESFTVGSTGTFIIRTSGTGTSSLSETGTLPSGIIFHDRGNGTATLSGDPTAGTGGVYSITLGASNGYAPNASQSFTLTVLEAPSITNADHTSFAEGHSGTFTFTTDGYPTNSITEDGALPSGVSFVDNGDGTATLSGTPAAGSHGIYSLSLDAGNGIGADATQSFTLTVGLHPTITSASSATFTTGQPGSFTINTSGYPAGILSKTGSLPSGVTFTDNGDGTATIAGTPGASTGGTYSLTIGAGNTFSPDASQNFTLTVDQAPAIASTASATFTTGQAGSFTFHTSGFPVASLSKIGALPSGVSFVDNGDGTATLSGTPTSGHGGVYDLTVAATNGVGADASQPFVLTVDDAPAITSASSASFTAGTAGSFTVSTSGFPLSTLSETGSLPTGLSFTDNGDDTATISGTPATGDSGAYTLQLHAANGIGANAAQTFTLTLDEAPSISSANHATFTVGSAGSFTVQTAGYPISTLSKTGALPSGLTFTDNGDDTATISGTPAAGTGGVFNLTLGASNGIGSAASQSFTLTVDQAPAITSTNHVTFTTGTTGSFTFQTTGFPVATLSETGALPGGVTFTDNGDGTATLAGVPTSSVGGTYALTVGATNGVGANASQSFTLTVDQAPSITSANHATFVTGTAGSFTVNTAGFPISTLTETGSLPSGLTFVDNGNDTATLAGTPGATTGGTYNLTFHDGNGIGSNATQSFTLTVNQAPAITSADNQTFTVGQAGLFLVHTTGFPTATLSETGSLPAGVSFVDKGNGTAQLLGTPTAGSGGDYTITLNAANGVGSNASQSFDLTVFEAPAITSGNSSRFVVGTNSSTTITTHGFPAPDLSETGSLPSGLTFVDNHDGTATLAGTAGVGAAGDYSISILASSGVGADATQSYTIHVGLAPTITSVNHATFTTGSAGSFTIQTTANPTAAISETGSLPPGVSFLDNGDGTATISGTPTVNAGGTYTLTLGATNTYGADASQTFTLTVDQAPAITSANHTTFAAGTYGLFVVHTSGFPLSTLSKTGSLPSGLTFVDNGDDTATISGTPGASTGGTYTLTLGATNGVGANASQTFTLTVDQTAAITSTNTNHATFTTGSAGSFTINTSGFPLSTLSESGSLPAGVTFIDNGDDTATLSGTPASGTGGTFALTLTASNGFGADATQSFTLTVDQAPAITSANHATFTAGTYGSFTINTSGFPLSTLSKTGTLPTGLTFLDNGDDTATISGTPGASTGGVYTLTLGATNGVGANASQVFTLTVDQSLAITSANHATFTTGQAGSFTVNTSGFPVSTLSESGSLPSGVTFTDNGDNTATISGTPGATAGGTYTLTLHDTNGVSADVSQAFTLTVNQAPAFTTPTTETFTAGSPGTFIVRTTGYPVAALSETGALPSGVTFHDRGDGTALISGTPAVGTGGDYSLTFTADSGAAGSIQQNFVFTVAEIPAITSAASTQFTPGTAGSFTVHTLGFPVAGLSESGTLPGGVTFVDNGDDTATIAGTPANGSEGVYTLTLIATNNIAPATHQSFTLTVGEAPTITSANSTTFTAGSAGTFSLAANGFPAATYSETGALPTGVTFNSTTGVLSGTPAAGTGGTYSLVLGATNGFSPDASQNFTLTVDEASSITSANHATFTAGSAGSFTVSTAGFPLATLSQTGTLPSGVSFLDNGDGTATLSGTPATGTGGTYSLTLGATNGVGSAASQSFTLTIDEATTITSANSATFTAGTAGSFTVNTAGLPVGALSETGSLPTGVSFVDNGDGTATLAGTPAASTGGAYSLTLGATNGIGAAASQAFTLTVDQAPSITSANHATFTVGSAGSFTVNTAGFPVAALSETGALPGGVSFLDNGDGTATISGTPAASTGGAYTLTLGATNGVGTDASQSFTLTVDQAPTISSANHATFTVGSAGSFTIATTGTPIASLSESGSLPGGVSFVDNGDGTATISGTPAAHSGGTYSLTLGASNGVAEDASQSFTLTVDEAPAITSANHATFTVGTSGSFTVNTGGFPAAALSEIGTLPSGVSFSDNGNGTATLAGIPAASTGGSYSISFGATNGIGSNATQPFTLTVDQAPAITSANHATFTVGTHGAFTVNTNGVPISSLTETGALPSGLTFVDNGDDTATLSGTPANFTGGTYSLTLHDSNGIGSAATQAFTLTVNQAPAIITANHVTFTVGTHGNFNIATSGFPDSTLSSTGTLPGGVTFTNNGNGTASITGTPDAGTGGTYVLSVGATNGVGSNASQSFTLTIDQAPAITSANHATFTTGTHGSFTLATTGFPAGTLSETGTLPSGVSFVDNGNGTATLSGTPAGNAGGTYSLSFGANNGVGSAATQAFTLTVDQAPTITSANHATFTVGSAGSFTVSTAGFPVATLSKGGTLPGGVSFVDNGNGTATISGTPGAGTGGTYVLTLGAGNGIGANASQSFTLTVDEAPAITSADHATFTTGTAGTFTISTSGFPVGSLSSTGTLPSGVTFTDNGDGSATLSGTPATATGGTYVLTLGATNGVGADASQSFTLTVDQAPVITSLNNVTFTAGVSSTFTVSTAGFPTGGLTESGTLPGGVSFTDNGDGTATLAGTPDASSGGTYVLSLGASNGIGTDASQAFTLTVDQAPAITSANAVTFTSGTSGSFTITTAGFPVAAFTQSSILPSGVTFTDNGDGTATLAGTPAAGVGGTYHMMLSASNGVGMDTSQTLTITVDDAPTITSVNHATFTTGSPASFTFTTTGFPAGAVSETGALPSGMTFTDNGDGTATLAGTPADASAGSYPLSLTASNGVGDAATQSYTLTIAAAPPIAIASATGDVTLYNPDGSLKMSINAFPNGMAHSPRIAMADVNGDGTPDIIVAGGKGGAPRVKIFDGTNGNLLSSFLAYPATFKGGLFVATGDVNGDGTPDIIVSHGTGGPRVRIFDGTNNAMIANFLAFSQSYTGGVRLASADFNRDGKADVVVAQGAGGTSQVQVLDGASILAGTPTSVAGFAGFTTPFDSFTGGATVATGDVNDDGRPELIVGEANGGEPRVRVYDGTGALIQDFLAGNADFAGGIRVSTADVNGDGHADIVTAQGPAGDGVNIYSGADDTLLFSFTPANSEGGLFVG